jgi:hypothetical protein
MNRRRLRRRLGISHSYLSRLQIDAARRLSQNFQSEVWHATATFIHGSKVKLSVVQSLICCHSKKKKICFLVALRSILAFFKHNPKVEFFEFLPLARRNGLFLHRAEEASRWRRRGSPQVFKSIGGLHRTSVIVVARGAV